MKPFITSIFLLFLSLSSYSAKSQIVVLISQDGQIAGLAGNNGQEIEYMNVSVTSRLYGKFSKIGGVKIEYTNVSISSPLYGKVAKIGDIKVEYMNVSTSSRLYGKVAKIGDVEIEYTNVSASSPLYGKVAKINNNTVALNNNKVLRTVSGNGNTVNVMLALGL